MSQKLNGTGVALITPFLADGQVDFNALEQLVADVTKGGVDFLVALGTTGESVTLSFSEKEEVLATIIKANTQKLPIVCGIGGNDTKEVIHQLCNLDLEGVEAILSVTPYYNKPTQDGLYAHYKAVAAATELPIILYNVPGRTSCNLLPKTVCRLAQDCKNIIGIKEASGNIVQCMELLHAKPTNFIVLSGDDNLIMPQIVLGMDGIISVAANCFPKEFTEIVNLSLANKIEKARKCFYKLLPGIDLLFTDGNPAGVKSVLSQQGKCENILRLPLVPVSNTTSVAIGDFLKEMALGG